MSGTGDHKACGYAVNNEWVCIAQGAVQCFAPPKPKDAVQHPSHYGGDVVHEVIKCLSAWGLESDALLWNAVKYISRAGKKDPAKTLEDLRKAKFYLDRRIAQLEAKA